MSVGAPSACGIAIAKGDPDRLDRAWALLKCTADGVDEHATTLESAAVSLAPGWHGQAAAAYQELSSETSTVYRQAAGTLRTASAVLRRYSAELARCQREGMTATQQAEHCLAEIERQEGRLRNAQRAANEAQRALDAAKVRAASSVGFPASSVHGDVVAAQADLSQAQAEEASASQAIARAQEDLSYWQAHGLRAWEESQTSAGHASGGLSSLSMSAPPVAAPSASPAGPAAGAPSGKKKGRETTRTRGKARTPKKGRGKIISGGAPLPGRRTRHEPTVGHSSPLGGLLGFAAVPVGAVAVTGPSRGGAGAPGAAGKRGGDQEGSGTMTIDPTSGTVQTVTRTKSGETIETITYTRSSGGTIETVTFPKSGGHAGSGATVVNPGSGPAPGPRRPGGAKHAGSGKGSGTTTVG